MPVTSTHRKLHTKRQNSRASASVAPSSIPRIIVLKDEFAPAPNKRRRFDAEQSVTEEEARRILLLSIPATSAPHQQHRQSPPTDNLRPLWDLFQSSYSLLMDQGIIESCKAPAGSLDRETAPESAPSASPASAGTRRESGQGARELSLAGFFSLWKELNDWLCQLRLRLQRSVASRAERYLICLEAEADLRSRLPARTAVAHYASALCKATPRLTEEVSAKIRELETVWLAVEAGLEQPPSSTNSLLCDLAFDLDGLQTRLSDFFNGGLIIPAEIGLADASLLTQQQKADCLNCVQRREQELQSKLNAIDAVHKVLECLSDSARGDAVRGFGIAPAGLGDGDGDGDGNSDRGAESQTAAASDEKTAGRLREQLLLTERLRRHYYELWIQLLEFKYSLDDDFQVRRQFSGALVTHVCAGDAATPVAAATASALAGPSSWGAESGFASELSPRNCHLAAGSPVSVESYDVLPFSESALRMFRAIANSASLLKLGLAARQSPVCVRHLSEAPKLSPAEFDAEYLAIFNNPRVDGSVVRKAMQDLYSEVLVPEPELVTAALKACRRLNDYALAVRFLEATHFKCGPKTSVIWPWLLQQIKPTLTELGISTCEDMGYDKPELFVHPEQSQFE